MPNHALRAAVLGLACALIPAVPSAAQLLPGSTSLPGLGGVTNTVTATTGTVTGTVGTVTGAVGGATGTTSDPLGTVTGTVGSVVGGVTGAAGGLITDPTQGVTGTVGGLLGGSPAGTLPTGTVTELITVLLGGQGAAGGAGAGGSTSGSAGSAPPIVGGAPNGTVVDQRAPVARFRTLSRLSRVGRTGKLVLRVTSDEAGVVVFQGAVRPGKGIRRHGRVVRVSRKLVKFRPVLLGFRKAGALRVTLVVSRSAQRALGSARDARLSVQALAVDLARNQHREAVKQRLHR